MIVLEGDALLQTRKIGDKVECTINVVYTYDNDIESKVLSDLLIKALKNVLDVAEFNK